MTQFRLGTAPDHVREAAYKAVHDLIENRLNHWNNMFKGAVMREFASTQGQQLVMEGVDAALDAAEAAAKPTDTQKKS